MAKFISNANVKLEIDEYTYFVNIAKTDVVSAIQEVAEVFVEMAKEDKVNNEEELEKEVEKTVEQCKKFITAILGEEAYSQIMEKQVEDYIYLVELTTFILNEIRVAKENRIQNFLKVERVEG